MTQKRITQIIIFIALFAIPTIAFADGSKLIGTWQAHSMTKNGKTEKLPADLKIVMTFTKSQMNVTFTMGTNSRSQSLKYTVKGSKISVTEKEKVSTKTFAVKGNTLIFSDKKKTLKLIRIKSAKNKPVKKKSSPSKRTAQ